MLIWNKRCINQWQDGRNVKIYVFTLHCHWTVEKKIGVGGFSKILRNFQGGWWQMLRSTYKVGGWGEKRPRITPNLVLEFLQCRILLKIPIGRAAILTSRWLHLLRLKETDSMMTKNFVWSLKTMDKGWPKKAGKTVTCSIRETQLRPFFSACLINLGRLFISSSLTYKKYY